MSSRHNYNRMSYVSEEEKEVMEDLKTQETEQYVDPYVTVESLGDKPAKTGFVFNCSKLNLREIPDITGKVLTILKVGQILYLGETHGEWIEVQGDRGDVIGYVMNKYIEL